MSLFKWYQWLIKPFEELKNLCKRALKNGSAVDDDCRVFHFQVILKVLITMAVLSVNLFDVQKYTEQASVSNFKRFMSAFYDDAYRDDIVIITFDDSDFPLVEEWDINPFAAGQPDNGLERTMSSAWPLSAFERRRFIEFVGEAQPEAIFVDLYMPSGRSDSQSDLLDFKNSLEDIANTKNIPVIIADLPDIFAKESDYSEDNPGILPLIRQDARSPIEIAMTGWLGIDNEYPLFIEPTCANARVSKGDTSAIESCDEQSKDYSGPENPDLPTPKLSAANALYSAYSRKENGLEKTGKINIDLAATGRPVSVMWGNKPPQQFGEEEESFLDALYRDISVMFTSDPRIMFHRQVSGKDVINLVQNGELDKLLKGKYVLIGANIAGINDIHPSPIHGNVPAIHLHAMALDNLMSYQGDSYVRGAPDMGTLLGFGFSTKLSLLDILEVLMVTLIFYWSEILNRQQVLPVSERTVHPWQLIIVFDLLLLIFSATMYWVFRFIPANLAMLLTVSTVTFIPAFGWSVSIFEKSSQKTQKYAQLATIILIIGLLLY